MHATSTELAERSFWSRPIAAARRAVGSSADRLHGARTVGPCLGVCISRVLQHAATAFHACGGQLPAGVCGGITRHWLSAELRQHGGPQAIAWLSHSDLFGSAED